MLPETRRDTNIQALVIIGTAVVIAMISTSVVIMIVGFWKRS